MKKSLNLKSILDIIAGTVFGVASIFILINWIFSFINLINGFVPAVTFVVSTFTNIIFSTYLLTGATLIIVNKFKKINSKNDKYLVKHFGDVTRLFLGALNLILITTVLCEFGPTGTIEIIVLSVVTLFFAITTLVVSLLPLINKNLSKKLLFLLSIVASVASLIMVIFRLLIINYSEIVGYVFFILGDILLTVISCLLYFGVIKEDEVKENIEEIKIDDFSKLDDDATKLDDDTTLNDKEKLLEEILKDQCDYNSENKN